MPAYPPVYLLRHGQTEWNLALRLQGSMDSALTPLGREQAAVQRRLLEPIVANQSPDVVVSPLGRTRQTAEIALNGLDLSIAPRFDARVAEINSGDWEGLERSEIALRWPYSTKPSNDFEYYTGAANGEGCENLRRRCSEFLSELEKPTVVITHGVCSVMLRGILCNLTHEAMCALPLTQGCIFQIRDGEEVILQEAK